MTLLYDQISSLSTFALWHFCNSSNSTKLLFSVILTESLCDHTVDIVFTVVQSKHIGTVLPAAVFEELMSILPMLRVRSIKPHGGSKTRAENTVDTHD
jgi:hypothetical protein